MKQVTTLIALSLAVMAGCSDDDGDGEWSEFDAGNVSDDDVSDDDVADDDVADDDVADDDVADDDVADDDVMSDDDVLTDDDAGIQDDDAGIQDDDAGIQDDDAGIQDDDAGIQDDAGTQDDDAGNEDPLADLVPIDPDTANRLVVDRFNEAAGTLMVRTVDNGLPEAGEPINFDQGPFITWGLGPMGNHVKYYNFDVQNRTPAPLYVIVREGELSPVEDQLNIVDVVPGDAGYSDFWRVNIVSVPDDYVANTLTDYDQIIAAELDVGETDTLVNCPVVPDGSTATLRLGDENPVLHDAWFDGSIVSCFMFSEASVRLSADQVPVAPIYVTFNINPDQVGGGPISGFVTETDRLQTHNVVSSLPGDSDYSPLWLVSVYDNADFDAVANLDDIDAANILSDGVATVNCPIVAVGPEPVSPGTAQSASIDRFSEEAGTLMVRNLVNGLPEADEPIDFDAAPFNTQGFGPSGEVVRYYNFDVQSTTPAPLYTLVREGDGTPIAGQFNVFDVIPGETGYNDFMQVITVTVPSEYVANTITSVDEIESLGYPTQETSRVVNRPIVPDGSTAELRLDSEDTDLRRGWYNGMLVYYFAFNEAELAVTTSDEVPVSSIYVTFNTNPGETGGGPASGFLTETGSVQTHNVLATLPSDAGYSSLWLVNMYDNADFDSVSDLTSAQAANILMSNAATVNCPVVDVE